MSRTGRWNTQATVGLILLMAGVVVAVVLLALSIPAGAPLHPSGSSASALATSAGLGENTFQTGTDENGRLIPRSGVRGMMRSAVACADCHGTDARGQTIQMMMSQIEAPDIRWSALTAPPADPAEKAFAPDSFFLAVTQGIDPEGGTLEVFMPRWKLSRAEGDALIEYLKTR